MPVNWTVKWRGEFDKPEEKKGEKGREKEKLLDQSETVDIVGPTEKEGTENMRSRGK